MATRSKIGGLPSDIREQLNDRLVKNGFTEYQALSEWLESKGYKTSRSTIHRYGKWLREQVRAEEISKIVTGLSTVEQAIILIFGSLPHNRQQHLLTILQKKQKLN